MRALPPRSLVFVVLFGALCSSACAPKPTIADVIPWQTCSEVGALSGAPIPMRRLNRVHIEQTLLDVFGVADTVSVTDEKLFTYRSNVSSPVDDFAIQAYFDFAERAAAKISVARCTDAGACTTWLLDEVGPRLFRRPLDDAQRARYTALYTDAVTQETNVTEAARWVLEAMLQSPSFLYLDEPTDADGYLDGYGVAARLSLMLFGANPDAELLAAAKDGALSTADGVRARAQAMLADARSAHGLQSFVTQWLELERLHQTDARPDLAVLGAPILDAMEREPAELFRSIARAGGTFNDLLTAPRTVAAPELDLLYLDDERAGLLTLPGVMASLAHANVTSPTARGFAVLSNLMCTPPPPPPAGLSITLPEPTPTSTTRERLEAHFSDPSCAGCHKSMDGLGFAFEAFDALGRVRKEDGGKSIDDHADFSLGSKNYSIKGARELSEVLAQSDNVKECVTRQWMRYATGIPEKSETACLVTQLARGLSEERGLEELVVSLAASDYVRKGNPQ